MDARRDLRDAAQRSRRDAAGHDRRHGAAVRRRRHDRHRAALRAVPRLAQHPARPADHAQGAGRSARWREIRQMVPRDAGDGPDRDLDGAPRVRRPLHEEPGERQPRRAGDQHRAARHVRRLAGAERLLRRAIEAALRAPRRGARGAAGRDRRHRARWCRRWAAATGGPTSSVRGIQVGAGHRQQLPFQPGRTGLFQDDGHSAPGRARIRAARQARRSESGHRQRSVREEVQSGHDAVGKRMGDDGGRTPSSTSRSSGSPRTPSTARSKTRSRRCSSGPTGRTRASAR